MNNEVVIFVVIKDIFIHYSYNHLDDIIEKIFDFFSNEQIWMDLVVAVEQDGKLYGSIFSVSLY